MIFSSEAELSWFESPLLVVSKLQDVLLPNHLDLIKVAWLLLIRFSSCSFFLHTGRKEFLTTKQLLFSDALVIVED